MNYEYQHFTSTLTDRQYNRPVRVKKKMNYLLIISEISLIIIFTCSRIIIQLNIKYNKHNMSK